MNEVLTKRGGSGRKLWLGVGLALTAGAWAAVASSVSTLTMAWNASTASTVAGYYLYYGTNSGVYSSKIDAGTNTTLPVTGVAPGTTYYFSVTSYSPARVESPLAQEVSYIVPGLLALTPAGGGSNTMRLQFPVAPLHYYELQYSTNLAGWNDLWVTPVESSNVWAEFDQPVTNTPGGQFFRLILH